MKLKWILSSLCLSFFLWATISISFKTVVNTELFYIHLHMYSGFSNSPKKDEYLQYAHACKHTHSTEFNCRVQYYRLLIFSFPLSHFPSISLEPLHLFLMSYHYFSFSFLTFLIYFSETLCAVSLWHIIHTLLFHPALDLSISFPLCMFPVSSSSCSLTFIHNESLPSSWVKERGIEKGKQTENAMATVQLNYCMLFSNNKVCRFEWEEC